MTFRQMVVSIYMQENRYYIPMVISALWILLYLGVACYYSLNIPLQDDYADGLLLSVIQLSHTHHVSDFFNLLIQQHNEHRLATTRLIAYFQYSLFGKVNFIGLILFANLVKTGLFLLIIRLLPKLNPWHYLVMTLFFFQLADHEIIFWAMAGLSAYIVLFLALITLVFISRSCEFISISWSSTLESLS